MAVSDACIIRHFFVNKEKLFAGIDGISRSRGKKYKLVLMALVEVEERSRN